ncbi:4Fe-4S dicluster domain-containing protein [Coraliomargarita sp. SDUM461004]|uniref:4Fe-4S dicluster domain-containing protein n=1 Tax=Thalassobacterium sedimentorum TaxID=3041258 RepID=A0ABU1AKX4_9BACT|nr:4Fe-4S dicluster domain-containing protein [Coraliomargarita sp. SDUM461004]MDQ8194485.1 4Fe-4S dicluster domain-containing protein [Coraliomargarita sp. SDUM461004]
MPRKKQYSMVIDLDRCVGCTACDISCKRENNTPEGFAWSNHIIETKGRFPNTSFRYIPTLCNHCTNAPCVKNCPTTAMHKDANGLTKHDANKCIGCRACQTACPYGVIYFNKKLPHKRLRHDTQPAIAGCTSTGVEVAEKVGAPIGTYNAGRAQTYPGIRPQGIVEKCTFCDHRLARGEMPACVGACPADARIFGDRNDPQSPVAKLLTKHAPKVLQPEKGTQPNVLYINEYH